MSETSVLPRTAEPRIAADWEIEVFYDGDCPLCRREIRMLQRWDHRRAIRFTNIADGAFDAGAFGLTQGQLMAEIHGRLPNGQWITGVEVFRRLYGAVGFRWLVWTTRLPLVKQALEAGYRVFARHRLKLTGRCHGGEGCRIDAAGGEHDRT